MPLPAHNVPPELKPDLIWFERRATSAFRLADVERRMTSLSLMSSFDVHALVAPAMLSSGVTSVFPPPDFNSADAAAAMLSADDAVSGAPIASRPALTLVAPV